MLLINYINLRNDCKKNNRTAFVYVLWIRIECGVIKI